jgi:hypothetical protein
MSLCAGLATAQAEQLVIAGYRTQSHARADHRRGALGTRTWPDLPMRGGRPHLWGREDDDYYVLADGAVVGRIIQLPRRGAT